MKAIFALGFVGLFIVCASTIHATACPLPLSASQARIDLSPPSARPIANRFGVAKHPVLGVMRMHAGIDYEGPVGEPVMAAASGQVAEASWVGEFGNGVVIDHGAGYSTGYLHMARIAPRLKPGDCITSGTVIGFIGATGLIATPHLHFEVTRHGIWLDPEPYLAMQRPQ